MGNEMKDLLQELLKSQQEISRQSIRSAQLLEQLIQTTQKDSQQNSLYVTDDLNSELFLGITDVYFNEENQRLKLGNSKKSGRRVSFELTSYISSFLNKHLSGAYSAERETDGFIYVWREEEPICAVRFITDKGFIRGDKWYEITSELVGKVKYSLKSHQVFFIIASLRNGLDQQHIQNYLGHDIGSNWQFLQNRNWVEEYIRKVQDRTTCLADPNNQIIYLAAELHPNVLADDFHKMTPLQREVRRDEVRKYKWIHQISDLLRQIEAI